MKLFHQISGQGRPKGSYLTHFFRIRFALVLFSLVVLIGIVLGLAFGFSHHEKEHTYIINRLGRQRMLSQQMAKEASRMAALYEALRSADRVQSERTLRDKLDQIRPALLGIAREFGDTLSQARTGSIAYGAKRFRLFDAEDPVF